MRPAVSAYDAEVNHARAGRASSDNADSTAQLGRRVLAELVGTALLLIAVIGSGIAAQSLSPGDTGVELRENALASGAGVVAIILSRVRVRRASQSGGQLG